MSSSPDDAAPIGGTIEHERFEIVRRIGAGGMGTVYEAIDRESGAHVALKTLRDRDASSLRRFKQEFRALSHVHHPNLVTLHELFEHRDTWFFTMELLSGTDLMRWVRPGWGAEKSVAVEKDADETWTLGASPSSGHAGARTHGGTLDPARLRAVLPGLARALVALHAAGKVHRDVKPSNVMVTDDGCVKVLDFGLVASTGEAQHARFVAGTAIYMAPEQPLGQVGPAADWYAVGVVLFQALTGRVPFSGELGDVAMAKRTHPATRVRALAPHAPEDLAALADALLAREPADRPDGEAVLRALAAEPEHASLRTRFVGRRGELAVLEAAFARRAEGAIVLVTGESGVGKSALVEAFVRRVRDEQRALVLAGRCHEREAVPYKAVDGVIDALAEWLDDLERPGRYLPDDVALLARLFPALGAFARDVPGPVDAQELRARALAALRALLTSVARAHPLVLVVDDVQWADPDGLAVLREIVRAPAPPLMLVMTLRPSLGGERATRDAADIRAALGASVRELSLSGLDPRDARELACALSERSLTEGEAQALADEAGGHPLFIDALVRSRRAEGARPADLEAAIRARAHALGERERALVELIAVAGAPIALEAVAHASEIALAELAAPMGLLRAESLVKAGGSARRDRVEPYHDRVKDAVLRGLEKERRIELHRRLAAAYLALEPQRAEAISQHLEGAGEPVEAARYALEAAIDADVALAFERAARGYRRALELASHPVAEERAIRSRWAKALGNAGRGRESALVHAALLPGAPAEERVDIARHAADQFLRAGHIDDGLAMLSSVLDEIGMTMPGGPRSSLARLVARRAQLWARGLAFVERAPDALDLITLRRIDVCWSVATKLSLVDTVCAAYFQTRGLLLALDAGEPSRIARAVSLEAAFSASEGWPARARTQSLVERSRSLADELGTAEADAWAEAALGFTAGLEGRWMASATHADRAAHAFAERVPGMHWEISTLRWFATMAHAYLGRAVELSRRLPAQLHDAERRGDLYGVVGASTGIAALGWLARESPSAVLARAESAMRGWSQATFHVEHWWHMLGRGHVRLAEGDPALALMELDADWPRLSRSMLLRVQLTRTEAHQLRARARLALALERRGPVRERLLDGAMSDASQLAGEGMPFSLAWSELVVAAVLHHRGDDALAVRRLEAAASELSRLSMSLYALSAQRALGLLLGGDRGRMLVLRAEDQLASEGVRDPVMIARTLAPGFDR